MDEARAWKAAATRIADDAESKIRCPSCTGADLFVADEPAAGDGTIERHMRCPHCGAHETLRIRRPL